MSGQPVHSVLFEQQDTSASPYYVGAAPSADNLQFYPTSYGDPAAAAAAYSNSYYSQAVPAEYSSAPYGVSSGMGFGGGSTGSFWSAFGTGGFDNEPPLLEELGVNFAHIMGKSLAVLNPLRPVNRNIMDDTDLAGPLLFWLLLGVFLMLSGKVHFGYIYGVAVFGVSAICAILNLMSETNIDVYRTASVLGYCLLPMVILSGTSIIFSLSGLFGLLMTALSVAWCTFVSSGFFVSVLAMADQRLLVGYPVLLFYGCFALMTVF